jgi:hypothetical protein
MKITQVISFASNKFGNRVKVYTQFESVIDYCRAVFGPGRSAEPEPELSRSWAGETQGLGITEQIGGLGSHIRDRPQRHRHTESSALAHTHTHRTIYHCYI